MHTSARRRMPIGIAIRAIATLLLTAAVLAATAASSPGSTGAARAALAASSESVPPRSQEPAPPGASFAALSDTALWDHIDQSDRAAVIGLKAPGQPRGVWKARVLVDAAGRDQARRLVLSTPGVSFMAADAILPSITVRLDSLAALKAIRRLPVVDYVEPAAMPQGRLSSGSSTGCFSSSSPSEVFAGGSVYDPSTDSSLHPLERIDTGDVLPWNYHNSRIPEAWARGAGATGQGVTVSVIDTGLYDTQTQLHMPGFAAGLSGPRSVTQMLDNSFLDPADVCGHGTRMAGTATAPRDGVNIVGVAWKANLRAVKAMDGVVITFADDNDVVQAIRDAAAPRSGPNGTGANVVVAMAFGDVFWHSLIADEIRRQLDPAAGFPGQVLFVGAAGTWVCEWDAAGNEHADFPAQMPEVLAVTGAGEDGTLHWTTCTGPEVDAAVTIGEIPAPGRHTDDLIHFGGSSDSTALTAGVAALVWSTHPSLTADQVRNRILFTARSTGDGRLGHGIVDAYGAVGGYIGLWIDGPDVVEPGTPYDLVAVPIGDGPWSYQWSTGATGTNTVHLVAGRDGTYQHVSVTVTDQVEHKSLTAAKTVKAAYDIGPCLRQGASGRRVPC